MTVCLQTEGGETPVGHPDQSASRRPESRWLRGLVPEPRSGCYGRILFIINKQVAPRPAPVVKAGARSRSPESAKSISLVLFRPHSRSPAGPGLIGKTSFRILLSLI